ncbi:hypothetical protein J6590_058788 [Homalodisca vitripennis]|nr:hypothetical protein J6590_058788 [Homalodisca vitripennis]
MSVVVTFDSSSIHPEYDLVPLRRCSDRPLPVSLTHIINMYILYLLCLGVSDYEVYSKVRSTEENDENHTYPDPDSVCRRVCVRVCTDGGVVTDRFRSTEENDENHTYPDPDSVCRRVCVRVCTVRRCSDRPLPLGLQRKTMRVTHTQIQIVCVGVCACVCVRYGGVVTDRFRCSDRPLPVSLTHIINMYILYLLCLRVSDYEVYSKVRSTEENDESHTYPDPDSVCRRVCVRVCTVRRCSDRPLPPTITTHAITPLQLCCETRLGSFNDRSELEIAQVRILSLTLDLFISTIDLEEKALGGISEMSFCSSRLKNTITQLSLVLRRLITGAATAALLPHLLLSILWAGSPRCRSARAANYWCCYSGAASSLVAVNTLGGISEMSFCSSRLKNTITQLSLVLRRLITGAATAALLPHLLLSILWAGSPRCRSARVAANYWCCYSGAASSLVAVDTVGGISEMSFCSSRLINTITHLSLVLRRLITGAATAALLPHLLLSILWAGSPRCRSARVAANYWCCYSGAASSLVAVDTVGGISEMSFCSSRLKNTITQLSLVLRRLITGAATAALLPHLLLSILWAGSPRCRSARVAANYWCCYSGAASSLVAVILAGFRDVLLESSENTIHISSLVAVDTVGGISEMFCSSRLRNTITQLSLVLRRLITGAATAALLPHLLLSILWAGSPRCSARVV